MKDYYKILGVQQNASEDDMKRAYKRLAMKYHPDRNRDDPKKAEEKFKEVKEAYETLIDPQKRQMVDQGIDPNDPQTGGFGGGAGGFGGFGAGADFNDIFGSFFGDMFGRGGSARQSQRKPRGENLAYELEISLEEAVQGCKKDIKFKSYVECSDCNGTGSAGGQNFETCPHCHGTGQIQSSRGFFTTVQECNHCHGSGKVVKNPCKKCRGEGRVIKEKTVTVTIPKGIQDGMKLRLSGEGSAAPFGGIPGDLFVQIYVKEHPIFKRDEASPENLYCEIPISFTTAALGGKVLVPSLNGQVDLTIPAGTQTGKKFRLRGKGVQSLRSSSSTVGDIIVTVIVETPVNLTSEQTELLRKLDESLKYDVVKSKKKSSNGDQTPKSRTWFESVQKFFDDLKGNGKKE